MEGKRCATQCGQRRARTSHALRGQEAHLAKKAVSCLTSHDTSDISKLARGRGFGKELSALTDMNVKAR